MKPIKLEIEGLHSFAEKQIIDFSSLTNSGIFGIFGQTGSGKSTILDAIVLALYGKVQRSKTNCDFINLKSKKAVVSFTFSFVEGGKSKQYKVTRTFKRKPKNANEVDQVAELDEVGAFGSKQIMEGSSKVDKFIIDLLGMTDTEFLKCVALPQGEFSAFLKAKPNERVSIIGNIFDLNKYGEKLWEKVKRRTEEQEKNIAVLEGKLSVLGTVDKEALKEDKDRLTSIQSDIAKKQEDLAIISKTEKEEREVVALGAEKEEIKVKLSECEDTKASINFKKDALKKSKKLAEKKFLIDREEELANVILKEKDNIYTINEQIKAEGKRFDEISLNSGEEINSLKSEIEDDIIKLDRVKALLPIEQEVEKLKENESDLKHEGEVLKSKIESSNKKLSVKKVDRSLIQEKIGTINKEIDALKEDLNGYEVLLSYKLLSKFNGELKTYQQFAENKHADAVISLSTTIENMDNLKKKEESIKAKIKELHAKYNLKSSGKEELLFSQCEKLYVKNDEFIGFKSTAENMLSDQIAKIKKLDELENRKNKLTKEKLELDLKYKDVLEDIEKLELKKSELAAEKDAALVNNGLANIIKETKIGGECPICRGEVLQKNNVGTIDLLVINNAINNITNNIEIKLEKKENVVYKTARVMSSIEMVDAEIEKINNELEDLKSNTAKYFANYFGEDVADYSERLDGMEKAIAAEIKTTISDYKQEKVLFEQLRKNREEYIKQSSLHIFANEEVSIFAELLNSLSSSISGRDVEMLGILSQGENISLKLEEMDALNKKLEQKQLEKEELNQNIITIGEEILALETELARLNEQLKTNLEELDKLEELIKEKESSITSMVSGNVSDSINVLNKDISNKKYRVEELEKYIKEGKEALAEMKSNLSTKFAENKAHLDEHAKIAESIAVVLNELGIKSLADAKPYIIGEKDLLELENSIVTYETKLQHYTKRLEEIDEKLSGRISGGAILEQLSIQILELQEQISELKETATKLKVEITAKEEKLVQVEKLSNELSVLDKQYTTAKELYTLLKGKALLEYIAEEFIDDISFMASEKLQTLMDGRYELKYINKDFFVIDNFNDASIRLVSTLSGGEMFVVSLALALSISDAIVSKSNREVDFFFLDEGFGTLDKEYCEYIVDSLVKLANTNLTIGLISHIPELQERISEKLLVVKTPSGSKITHITDL